MTGEAFLDVCLTITFIVLCFALALIVYRIAKGPSLPDRILGLDVLVTVAIGFIAAFGIRSDYPIYVDIAIALGLVGFLSTIALARLVLMRGDFSLKDDQAEQRDD